MKRGASPITKPTPKKHKSKSKSKSKDCKFDPLSYLNSLISQLHDRHHVSSKRKPISSAKRDLASAMAHTTPHTERTAASSKVRSKSSYSQFRRKSVTLKQALKIDLNQVSEDDNIQFTQVTVKQSEIVSSPEYVELVAMSKTTAARKIQRAWRNYQTKKVVRKYYQYYRKVSIRDEKLKEKEHNIRYSSQQQTTKKEGEHTLKIRKEQIHSPNTTLKLNKPVHRILDFSQNLNSVLSKQIIKESYQLGAGQLHTIEMPVLKDTESREEGRSKELEMIVDLFKSSQQLASKSVQEQLSAFCKAQAILALQSEKGSSRYEDRGSSLFRQQQSHSFGQLQGLSPIIFAQMQQAVKQKYQLYKTKIQSQPHTSPNDRRKSLQQLEGRLLRQTRAIQTCKQQYIRSVYQLRQNMLKMQNDTALINKMNDVPLRVRKSYSADSLLMKSILEEVSFKNMELDVVSQQRQEMGFVLDDCFVKNRGKKAEEGIALTIPTSPPSVFVDKDNPNSGRSAQSGRSLQCYQIDNAGKLRQIMTVEQPNQILEDNQSKSDLQNYGDPQIVNIQQLTWKRGGSGQILTIPPIYDDDIPDIDMPSSDQQPPSSHQKLQRQVSSDGMVPEYQLQYKEGERSRMVRQSAQEIAVELQALVFWQMVEDIYLHQRMWLNFKPLVQVPYSFKPISDFQIRIFLQQELPQYYSSQVELLQKMNQKINPTSREILRLIRDFQFQVDQYELVHPQQVFKSYRKVLEQKFTLKINEEQQKQYHIEEEIKGRLREVVQDRIQEKRAKKAKFMSFQRDLRIMYMKSVFNCFNQLIIQTKSFSSFMNSRSSIGPGQLTLALKQYNDRCSKEEAYEMMANSANKILQLIANKCNIPQFKNHRDLQLFQKQMNKVIARDLQECEYKWINYMDQVLQLWQELSLWLSDQIVSEAVKEIAEIL